MAFFNSETECACADGPIECDEPECVDWADICQGLKTCWTHYEKNEERKNNESDQSTG